MTEITEETLERLSQWVEFFSTEFVAETPMRIHGRGTDEGHGLGGPPFHPEFLTWLQAGDEREPSRAQRDARQRVTRVFRRIRSIAPREYFVLQLVCTRRMNIAEVTDVMNRRAEDGGHPERYTDRDVIALLSSGLDKAVKWY